MAMSNYLEEAILNAVFRNIPFTSPQKVYVALYTSDPTDDDIGTEVDGDGYSRQEATFTSPAHENGKMTITNDSAIVFGPAAEDWGTVTHVGIRDAAAGGNLLYYGPLTTAMPVTPASQLRFEAGNLKITLE